MPRTRPRSTRVDLVWTGGALACAVVLTACGASTSTGPSPSAPTTPAPSVTTSAAPAASSSARTLTVAGVDTRQRSTTSARAVLATLAVKGRAPKTGYTRAQFGTAWTDATDDPLGHNGCDTRNDILRRDLTGETLKADTAGCVVLTGVLRDPYTATTIAFRRGVSTSTAVQIDHVVALGDAWQTGAQQLTVAQRTELANDPLELLAVDGSTNEAKGDGDAATWLPPNRAYRCAYVARQIAVKHAYHLWVTAAERAAMDRVLGSCPGQTVPQQQGQVVVTPPSRTATQTPTPTPTPTPTASQPQRRPASAAPSRSVPHDCTTTSSGNCIRGGQFCPRAEYGDPGYDAGGTRYVCRGDQDHPRWE